MTTRSRQETRFAVRLAGNQSKSTPKTSAREDGRSWVTPDIPVGEQCRVQGRGGEGRGGEEGLCKIQEDK